MNKIFVISIFLILFSACGLPQYNSLEPPISTSDSVYEVSFTTPTDTKITGYVLYYKIYDVSETTLIESDKAKFDESSYANSFMDLGDKIPSDNKFSKLTILDTTIISDPLIYHVTAGEEIFINFSSSYTNPSVIWSSTVQYELSRIEIDNANDFKYKTFNKWDWDDGDGDSIVDSDLKNLFDRVPTSNLSSGVTVAIVAYSYGINPGDVTILKSIPVYMGTISIDGPITDNDS